MKRLILIFSFISMTAILSGCAGMFKVPESGADFGSYPTNYKQLISDYMANRLKDPESARYQFGTPQKAYRNKGWALGGDVIWQGYLVDFSVNAKNSYGGYTGFGEPYVALIRNDRVYDVDVERMYFDLLHRY